MTDAALIAWCLEDTREQLLELVRPAKETMDEKEKRLFLLRLEALRYILKHGNAAQRREVVEIAERMKRGREEPRR
jgi:hypothetical protein